MASICVLISTPPAPDPEAAEMVLALAAFDHDVRVVFTGAGTGWLLRNQSARKPGGKSPDKQVAAFPLYDVAEICARASDIPTGAECLKARQVCDSDIRQWLADADYCLSF